jgi:hypothetical protein
VKPPAVDLDDEARLRPDEVDLEAADLSVRLHLGQARVADQLKQELLGLRAGEGRASIEDCAESGGAAAIPVAVEMGEQRVAADAVGPERDCERALERPAGRYRGQVEERPARGGGAKAFEDEGVAGLPRGGVVRADAGLGAGAPRERDVERCVVGWVGEEVEAVGRASVAERGAVAAGEDRCELARCGRQNRAGEEVGRGGRP